MYRHCQHLHKLSEKIGALKKTPLLVLVNSPRVRIETYGNDIVKWASLHTCANLYMFNVLILVSKLGGNIEKYYYGADKLGVLEA